MPTMSHEKAHFDAIRAKHSDLDEISMSDDFQGWLDRQPPMFRRIVEYGSAKDVIWMLDQYKAAVGNPHKETFAKPKFTRQQIKTMSQQEFERREAEIDMAIVNGRIV